MTWLEAFYEAVKAGGSTILIFVIIMEVTSLFRKRDVNDGYMVE